MNDTFYPQVKLFRAMSCPCEVLIDTDDRALAERLVSIAKAEAARVEAKFSRYISGNIVHQINTSAGRAVAVDAETAHLLDFADQAWRLSDGLFDITTGILRRAWTFNGKGGFPSQRTVEAAKALVGWDKVRWENRSITLKPGMEIDLGGIGKEYAVDRAFGLIREASDVPVLVNFGGDIAAHGPTRNGDGWCVGIERHDREGTASHLIYLTHGGLTTSGDSKKYVMHEGRRYGHILNPHSGYPIEDAPCSVSVAADTCTEAGFLSTLGMLKGREAESFLATTGNRFWVNRPFAEAPAGIGEGFGRRQDPRSQRPEQP